MPIISVKVIKDFFSEEQKTALIKELRCVLQGDPRSGQTVHLRDRRGGAARQVGPRRTSAARSGFPH